MYNKEFNPASDTVMIHMVRVGGRGEFPMLGRPTDLEYSRARAYYT